MATVSLLASTRSCFKPQFHWPQAFQAGKHVFSTAYGSFSIAFHAFSMPFRTQNHINDVFSPKLDSMELFSSSWIFLPTCHCH